MLRQVGIVVVTACASWSLCYILFGGTSKGKAWYGQFASMFWDDSKGGVPIVTLYSCHSSTARRKRERSTESGVIWTNYKDDCTMDAPPALQMVSYKWRPEL